MFHKPLTSKWQTPCPFTPKLCSILNIFLTVEHSFI